MTPEQVREFQRGHKNHLGKPLRVDGDLGPQTEWALDFSTICQARRTIVAAAQGFLDLAEVPPGSNDDPGGIIRSWLLRCGAKLHDPWCAAFASWCVSQGVAQAIRQASAQSLGRHFPATALPMTGDLYWYPTGPSSGHVGIALGFDPGEVMGIEGNCANACRCVRRPRILADGTPLRFSRTVEDTSGTHPGVVPSVPLAPGGTR